MGVTEVTLIEAGLQLAQAGSAFLARVKPTNTWAVAAVAVGQQIFANIAAGCKLGLAAATAEFATSNAAEKTFAASVVALPPIA